LTDRIGLPLKKVDAEKYDSLEYQFPHYNLVLLANEDGIVERAYPRGATVEISRVVDDLETVVKA
jgi:protein SCO1/2